MPGLGRSRAGAVRFGPVLNFLQNNVQLIVVLLLMSFSALGFVFRKLMEYRQKRQHHQNVRLAEIERLRTGRAVEPASEHAAPPPMTPQQARAAEIAARRQAQLEELRRRRQGKGAPFPVAQTPVTRIPGTSGPTVPGTRPPTRPMTSASAEALAAERRREIEEKRRAAQQRQRDLQQRQQEEIERQRAAQERQRASQERQRAAQEPQRPSEERQRTPRQRPAARSSRAPIGGSPWEQDADTGESTTHRIVPDSKPAPAASPVASALSRAAGWKRAMILREILDSPLAERDF